MKYLNLLFILCFSFSLKADPKTIEVIFLSRPGSAYLMKNYTLWSQRLASDFECVETEGGCFHPQLGFIKKEDAPKPKTVKPKVTENKILTNDTEDSFEHDCDKNFHFDVFCGKGKKAAPPSEYEVWVDVSSSMRSVDFSTKENFCERRYWINDLMNSCAMKFDVSVFNTSIKPLGLMSDLCGNNGNNDRKQIVEWLKRSKAKYILIITDREEYTEEFREYLDRVGAKIYGMDTKSILISDISRVNTSFKGICQ